MLDEHMTPEEIDYIKIHMEAARNAILYGVGFLKIEYINGKFKTSVVKTDDYKHLTDDMPEFNFKN